MATDLGLFASPEDIQRARSMEMAKMNAGQLAGYMGAQGGAALGQGLGKLFGVDVRDEQMKRADMARELAGKYGIQTAEAFNKMALEAQQRGDIPLAMKLRAQAASMETTALDAAKKQADITKAYRDSNIMQQLIKEGKYDPASVAKYERSGNVSDLKLVGQPHIDTVGVATSTKEPVYFDKTTNQQFTISNNTRIPYSGGVDRTTAKSSVSVNQKGDEAFVVELGKIDAQAIKEGRAASETARDQLTTLQRMQTVANRPVITGTGAELRTDVSNFFNTLGLGSDVDKMRTANSQEYIKYSTSLVLDNLKKTGYNPSNADMAVVNKIIPRLDTDPAARDELIKFMAEKAQEVISEAADREAYAREHKGLSGYVSKRPQIKFGKQATSVSDLTTEQLLAIVKGK